MMEGTRLFRPIPLSELNAEHRAALEQARASRERFLTDRHFPYLELQAKIRTALQEAKRMMATEPAQAMAALREIETLRPIEDIPSPELLTMYSYLTGRTGNPAKQAALREKLFGIQQAIAHSGDALAADTAIPVLFISEEYEWLRDMRVTRVKQEVVDTANAKFDVITARDQGKARNANTGSISRACSPNTTSARARSKQAARPAPGGVRCLTVTHSGLRYRKPLPFQEPVMSKKLTLAAFGLVVALSTAALAYAQDTTLTPQTSASGIAYVTGGIGDGQQEALKAVQSAYNLRLTVARKNGGNYLADVKVTVTGKGGSIRGRRPGPDAVYEAACRRLPGHGRIRRPAPVAGGHARRAGQGADDVLQRISREAGRAPALAIPPRTDAWPHAADRAPAVDGHGCGHRRRIRARPGDGIRLATRAAGTPRPVLRDVPPSGRRTRCGAGVQDRRAIIASLFPPPFPCRSPPPSACAACCSS
jgi:hypothetical protein